MTNFLIASNVLLLGGAIAITLSFMSQKAAMDLQAKQNYRQKATILAHAAEIVNQQIKVSKYQHDIILLQRSLKVCEKKGK